MTRKTKLGLIIALMFLALGLAACQSASPLPTSAALPPTATVPSVTPVVPTATALPPTPTASPVPPTDTALPPTPTDTPIPPTPLPSAEVIVKQMNLRAGPGPAYPIVALLSQGDILTVVGRSPDKTWLSVKTAGNVAGWCSASSRYVRLSVEVSTLAAVAVPPPPANAAAPTAAQLPVIALVPTATNLPSASATPASVPTEAPTQAPPTVAPSPVPAVQEFTLYFYFGAEGCPNSRLMGPLVEQFYQQYAAHAFRLAGVQELAVFRPGRAEALAIPLAARDGLRAPVFYPPLQGTIKWNVIGVPVSWWGGDPAAFRSATGVTFPFAGDPGLSVDTSRIPVTVVLNNQTGVYRTATVGAVSYSTLVYQVNAVAGGADTGPASGTA